MIDLDALVRDTYELAPLPATALRLVSLLANEDWELDAVVEAASLDGPLTGQILRVANSAANAPASEVATLSDATMRIGAGAVVRLATGSAVRSFMSGRRGAVAEQEEQTLWHHSVATALSAELVGLVSKARIPPEAFTAALLHDIGRVVLSRHVSRSTTSLVNRAIREAQCDLLEAEHEILGVDHAELGALVAQHWGLPTLIVDSIRFHHTPTEAPAAAVRTICDAIVVGDAATRSFAAPDEDPAKSFDCSDSRERLGIPDGGFEELGELLAERLELTMAQYE